MDSFIETALENNGAMVSTIEKMRIGVPTGGMSPESDMDTGGASYFFTRIKKLPARGKPTSQGLYFKKRLLRRMDAVRCGRRRKSAAGGGAKVRHLRNGKQAFEPVSRVWR